MGFNESVKRLSELTTGVVNEMTPEQTEPAGVDAKWKDAAIAACGDFLSALAKLPVLALIVLGLCCMDAQAAQPARGTCPGGVCPLPIAPPAPPVPPAIGWPDVTIAPTVHVFVQVQAPRHFRRTAMVPRCTELRHTGPIRVALRVTGRSVVLLLRPVGRMFCCCRH